jgi:hypothetical protein
MERTLVVLHQARSELGDEAPIPCDDHGNPTTK